jgi:hypothetical protein
MHVSDRIVVLRDKHFGDLTAREKRVLKIVIGEVFAEELRKRLGSQRPYGYVTTLDRYVLFYLLRSIVPPRDWVKIKEKIKQEIEGWKKEERRLDRQVQVKKHP